MPASLPALLAGQNPDAASLPALLAALNRITNWGILGLNGTASASNGTGTYADVAGGTLMWTKYGSASASDVLVIGSMSGFGSVANLPVVFGTSFTGTDYDLATMYLNTSGAHNTIMGLRPITGLAANTYTVKPRVRTNGGGTVTIDTNDTVTLVVVELPK